MDTKKKDVSRRDFMKDAAKVATGVAVGAAAVSRTAKADVYKSILPASVLGANEKIRSAHIGVGGMGSANLKFAMDNGNFQPIAVCDLLPAHRDRAAAMVKSGNFAEPSKHKDFREVMANKDVDAVIISTPDHWHAMIAITGCDAGKAVWCEKPLATTIVEGRHVVNAARRNNTVIQCGTMQRSGKHFQEAVQLVKSGHIGKVARVETFIHDKSKIEGIGNPTDPKPDELDWEFFQGWTKRVPFNKNRFLYNFRWFLDYSGGKMTDWGAHLIDIAVWAMGEEKKPKTVVACGGKFVLTDNRTTPDTLDVIYEFDDYVLSFTNRVWNPYLPYESGGHGIIFYGTLGTLRLSRNGYEVVPHPTNGGCEPRKADGSQMNEPHWQNFVDCIRDNKRPICDVEICHNTTTVCHLGTCAYVAGGKLHWDPVKEKFFGTDKKAVKAANGWAYRPYLNGWKLA